LKKKWIVKELEKINFYWIKVKLSEYDIDALESDDVTEPTGLFLMNSDCDGNNWERKNWKNADFGKKMKKIGNFNEIVENW